MHPIQVCLLTGIIVVLSGRLEGHTSSVESLDGTGAVELTIATIATERLTRIAYTFAKPRKPMIPSTVRLLTHPVVSSTVNVKTLCHENLLLTPSILSLLSETYF